MSGSDYYHIVLRFGAFGWVGRWWAANDQQGKMFPFIVIWEYYSLFTTIVYDIQYIIFATIQYCMINRSWVMIKYDKLCQSYFVGVWVCPQIGYHFMCCLTIYLQIQWPFGVYTPFSDTPICRVSGCVQQINKRWTKSKLPHQESGAPASYWRWFYIQLLHEKSPFFGWSLSPQVGSFNPSKYFEEKLWVAFV